MHDDWQLTTNDWPTQHCWLQIELRAATSRFSLVLAGCAFMFNHNNRFPRSSRHSLSYLLLHPVRNLYLLTVLQTSLLGFDLWRICWTRTCRVSKKWFDPYSRWLYQLFFWDPQVMASNITSPFYYPTRALMQLQLILSVIQTPPSRPRRTDMRQPCMTATTQKSCSAKSYSYHNGLNQPCHKKRYVETEAYRLLRSLFYRPHSPYSFTIPINRSWSEVS